MTNPIIILGSSRSFGETRKAVEQIIGTTSNIPVVDLNTLKISPYDYEHKNQDDDYFSLLEKVTNYDLIVLATPVYWYTMSAQMKIFIDRLSDLLDIKKDIGRMLRRKQAFIISSFNTSLPAGFEKPFEQTCNYMGIEYKGCSFIYAGNDVALKNQNEAQIQKAKDIIFTLLRH